MRLLFSSVLLIFIFFNPVNAKNTCNIMNNISSDWLKTQDWETGIINRWEKRKVIVTNRLLEGFENPVCHVFAAENNLIAGLEGLGKYPANPKKINYVEWQDFSDFDIDNNGKPLVAPKDLRKGIELAKFDLYNNNKPIIIEKNIWKGRGCDPEYKAATGSCIEIRYVSNDYSFNLYDITDKPLENFIRLKERNWKSVGKYKKELRQHVIDLRYEPVRTMSFFTYDGVSYMADREKIKRIKYSAGNEIKYQTYTSEDNIYRYDNGERKQVCHYGKFPSWENKKLLALNKLFNLMKPSAKAAFIVEFSTYSSYEEFLKGLDMLSITKENYAEQTIINKALLDEIYDRYNQIEKCKTGKELQPLTASLKSRKKVMQKKKASKPEDNKITLIAKKGKLVQSVMMNGKKIGILFPDDIVFSPEGKAIARKTGNKLIDIDGKVIGVIEE